MPKPTIAASFVIIEEPEAARTLLFRDPVGLLMARSLADIRPVLSQMQDARRAGFRSCP